MLTKNNSFGITNNTLISTTILYIKMMHCETQLASEKVDINMISVDIARFFGSPLLLLLIMEFVSGGLQITYLYYRLNIQRASKYNQLFKALKQVRRERGII